MANSRSLSSINFKLRADIKQFSTGLQNAERKMKKFAKNMKRTGQNLTQNFTAPIVAIGGGVVYAAANFEKSMNKVKAVSGATGKDFEALKNQAKELGKTTQFSASQAAEAMSFLGMAGFKTTQIIDAMPATLDLAAAGGLDLASAADIASNVLSGFGAEASELGRFSDVMTKGFTSTNQSLTMLGEAMAKVAPVASGFGLSVEETTAAIGLLSNAGIQGGEAGTSLKNILVRLDEESKKLGLSIFDTTGKMIPLADQMEQLEAKGLSTSEVMDTFKKIAGPGMLAMLKQGSSGLRSLTEELQNSGGTAKKVAETQMEGLMGTITRLKSATEGVAIQFGEMLLPVIEKLANRISNLLSFISNLSEGTKKMIINITALVATIGPALIIISKLSLAYIALRKAIFKTGAAIALFSTNLLRLSAAGFKANGIIGATTAVLRVLRTVIVANPVGALIVGLTAVIGLFKKFSKNVRTSTSDLESFDSVSLTAAQRLAEINKELEDSGKSSLQLKKEELTVTKDLIAKNLQAAKAKLDLEVDEFGDDLSLDDIGFLRSQIFNLETDLKDYEKTIASITKKQEEFNKKIREINGSSANQMSRSYAEQWGLDFNDVDWDQMNKTPERPRSYAEQWGLDFNDVDFKTPFDNLTTKLSNITGKIGEFAKKWGAHFSTAFSVIGQSLENQSIALDNFYKKESDAIANSNMNAEQKAAAQEALDERVAEKRKKIMRKQAIADKAIALFSAIIGTAEGIARNLKNPPLAIAMGVLGAAQIALIAAAPIPQFAEGGIVSGPTLGLMGEYAGARSNPEVIAPLNKLKSMLPNTSNQVFIPDLVIKGSDLHVVFERQNRRQA